MVSIHEVLPSAPPAQNASHQEGIRPEQHEWNSARVARQFASSAISLGVRQVLVQGSNLLGSLLLARILSPSEFGLYAVAIFWLSFLATFGGTGFVANLIRQPEDPTLGGYYSVFSIQLASFLGGGQEVTESSDEY